MDPIPTYGSPPWCDPNESEGQAGKLSEGRSGEGLASTSLAPKPFSRRLSGGFGGRDAVSTQ